jgi:hypothetical protein
MFLASSWSVSPCSELIEGAAHGQATPVEDMGIDHSRFHVLVSQQLLHGADVIAGLEQMSGEGMAESVGANGFVDPRQAGSLPDRLLQAALVQMVTTDDPLLWSTQ